MRVDFPYTLREGPRYCLLAIEREMYWICKTQFTQSALEDRERVYDYL